jgi:hypothetical protein
MLYCSRSFYIFILCSYSHVSPFIHLLLLKKIYIHRLASFLYVYTRIFHDYINNNQFLLHVVLFFCSFIFVGSFFFSIITFLLLMLSNSSMYSVYMFTFCTLLSTSSLSLFTLSHICQFISYQSLYRS